MLINSPESLSYTACSYHAPLWPLNSQAWPDHPQRAVIGGAHNGALTLLTRNKRLTRTVSSQTGHGGIVWRRTGESDHSRLLSKVVRRIACYLESMCRN